MKFLTVYFFLSSNLKNILNFLQLNTDIAVDTAQLLSCAF
jgi:hypothetical protein